MPLVADPLAIGAMLALACRTDARREAFARLVRRPVVWLAPAVVCVIESLDHRPNVFPYPVVLYGPLQTLANLGIMLIVARSALVTEGVVARILNAPVMVAIGVMSYSLYLWQMLFISPVAHRQLDFPLNVVWALLAATLSYLLIERPFLKLRDLPRAWLGESALRTVPVSAT